MLIDGRKIRDKILAELKPQFERLGGAVLAVIWVGEDRATEKFIEQKRKFAHTAGVELRLFDYENDIKESDLETEISRIATNGEIDGMIVQLPLPKQINTQKIIDLIPPEKDVDALGPDARVLSPVVAAVKEILDLHNVDLDKKFIVIGKGKLVGGPVSLWLAQNGADVNVVDYSTKDIFRATLAADVIVSGVGQPGLLTPDVVRDGVVLIDAGTNEQAGKLAGDATPECALKASLFTPVPGGVGPIVVAELYKNLWQLLNLSR